MVQLFSIYSFIKIMINHNFNKVYPFGVLKGRALYLHHRGIEPQSTAWKAAMLPLHQWCFNPRWGSNPQSPD